MSNPRKTIETFKRIIPIKGLVEPSLFLPLLIKLEEATTILEELTQAIVPADAIKRAREFLKNTP